MMGEGIKFGTENSLATFKSLKLVNLSYSELHVGQGGKNEDSVKSR